MSFNKLSAALRDAGLPSSAANQVASVIFNSVPKSPPVIDTTNPGMRSVGPQKRTGQFPNLDFLEGNPDYKPRRGELSENRPRPTQLKSLKEDLSPQQNRDPSGIRSGSFTETKSQGDNTTVGLKLETTGQILTINEGSESLVGKNLRLDSKNSQEGGVRFFLEEIGNEIVLKLDVNWNLLAKTIGDELGIETVVDPETGQWTPGGGGSGGGQDVHLTNVELGDTLRFEMSDGGVFQVGVTNCATGGS